MVKALSWKLGGNNFRFQWPEHAPPSDGEGIEMEIGGNTPHFQWPEHAPPSGVMAANYSR